MTHLKIWRTNDWAEVALAPAQVARVFSADLSPDDRHLAAGYMDDAVRLWSFPEGRLEAAFTNHAGGVTVLFSKDGQGLVSASLDSSVRLWDVAAHRQTAELPGHLGAVWEAALSPDGRRLATSASTAKDAVTLWDHATQREVPTLPPFLTRTSSPKRAASRPPPCLAECAAPGPGIEQAGRCPDRSASPKADALRRVPAGSR
jgi:WD40 repeat protein